MRHPGLARALLTPLALAVLLASCSAHQRNAKEMALGEYRMGRAELDKGKGIADEMNRRAAYPRIVRAVEKDPTNPDYHITLGSIYLFDQRYQEAMDEFNEVLRLQPGDPMAHYNLGEVYRGTKRYRQAIEQYDLALRDYSYPTPYAAHYKKGQVFFLLKEYEAAADSFRAAVAIVPRYADAWGSLGRVLEATGKYGEAEKALRKSLEINPGAAENRYYLGLVLFKLDKKTESIAEFRRFLESEPEGELARNAAQYISILD